MSTTDLTTSSKSESRLPGIRVRSRGGVQFESMADVWTLSVAICSAGMQPSLGKGAMMSPQQVMVAIQMGAEVGLPPMTALKNIAVIKGRPTIWGDALLALAYRHGLVEDFKEKLSGTGDAMVATCTTKRVGIATPYVRTFSVADAKQAGLWGQAGPWSTHPKRMLQMRARAFALRDAYPDALGGFQLAEEVSDYRTNDEEEAEQTSRSQQLLAELQERKALPKDAAGEEVVSTTEVPERVSAGPVSGDWRKAVERMAAEQGVLMDEEDGLGLEDDVGENDPA